MSDRSLTAAARSLLKPDLDARIVVISGLGEAAARVDSAAAGVAAATQQHSDAVAAYDTAYDAALRAGWTAIQLSELNLGRAYGRANRIRRRTPTRAANTAPPRDPSNGQTSAAGPAVEADSGSDVAAAAATAAGDERTTTAVSDPSDSRAVIKVGPPDQPV